MKVPSTICLAVSVVLINSCATNSKPAATASGQVTSEAAAAGATVLPRPQAKVQAAAVAALKSIGCDIKEQTPQMVSGKRSNKMGIMVGSGGETVIVNLAMVSTTSTRVEVMTKKSIVGIVGQKNWDDEVMAEIKSQLGL